MNVSRSSFKVEKVIDDDPDLSYLGEYTRNPTADSIDRAREGNYRPMQYRYWTPANPEYARQDYARAEAYNRGDWHMVGIRAAIDLDVPTKSGGTIRQTITSPGIWGVESDAGDDYIANIFQEECQQLADLLDAMGLTVEGGDHVAL